MRLEIKTDFKAVQQALNTMQKDIATKALARSLNATVEQARTAMVKEITSEYAVTARMVRERLQIRRASFRAGMVVMEAALMAGNGKRINMNLIHFTRAASVRRVASGKRGKNGKLPQLQFKIKKTGAAKVVRGAFIGNDGRTVFVRTSNARLPIEAKTTIGVEQMFNQRRINASVVRVMRDRFPAIFEREARFYTDKFNRGGR